MNLKGRRKMDLPATEAIPEGGLDRMILPGLCLYLSIHCIPIFKYRL